MPIQAGTKLGRYEIRSKIGAGGMGEVYLARDTELERTVALKVLPADVASDKHRMQRFTQEAKTASALNHPNILTIFEIGLADATHYIATEFIDGETLRQHMRGARLKLSDVLNIVIQTADALSAAHEAGIIHRDIKPENIMLRQRDAYVKVLDFGLAKLIEQPPATVDTEAPTKTLFKTEEGVVMGTVIYMSPEQARGLEVDARTDIWSLGVVLYEMVAGCLPFEGSTTSEILVAIINEKEQPPLARFAREVPAELERIVEKALRKDREERYQVIKDMLLDLKRLKQRLEFEAELERSNAPHIETTSISTEGGPAFVETIVQSPARDSDLTGARQTSSAEYLLGQVQRHKRGVAIVLAALLATVAISAYFYFARSNKSGTSNPAIDSIAVLPFVNVNASSDTEYLSNGITDSLINSLSQLPKLKVIARSSVFSYKGKEVDPQAVGRELNVQALVTGRIIQRGDNLLISVELVDTRDKSHIWGEQYNRKISDLLAVQAEISREISQKLRLKLTGEEQKRITKRYTENIEAYRLYLKGRFYWNKRTTEGYKKAIEHFEQAIEKDPSYALAYAGLADCYSLLGRFGVSPPQEVMAKAKAAAVKAFEIDDELAEAHTSLFYVKWTYDWDFQGAEKEIERAIELNPNYAIAHFWYAIKLAEVGRHGEAMASIRRAQELDPLSLIISGDTGMILYLARRYDEAIEQCRRTLEMDQNFFRARLWLGRAYEQKGMYEEAIAEFLKARQLDDTPITLAWIGHAYAASGKRSDALKVLDQLKQLSKQVYVDSYYVAAIHAALGEKDQAFELLEKAYVERSSWLSRIKVDPIFDGLRSDPRFADLVRRVGFPK